METKNRQVTHITPHTHTSIPTSTKASIRSNGRHGLGKATEEMREEKKRKNLARDGYTESTCCCVQARFLGKETKKPTDRHVKLLSPS